METKEIENLLSGKLPGKILKVEEINTRGERNHNFRVKTEGQNFIARRPKDKFEGKQEREKVLLEFLHSKDINFVPKSIGLYNDIHVITEVGEEDLEFQEASEDQIFKFIEKVVILHNLEVDELIEYARDKKPEIELLGIDEDIERFTSSRVQKVSDFQDQELIDSLKEELAEIKDERPRGELDTGLIHDDLSGNIRYGTDNIYLIDWEFSYPGKAPEREIGYIFAHEELNKEREDFIISAYADETGKEKQEIENRTRWWERTVLIGEIAYAIELQESESRYSERLEKWINRYNNRFKNIKKLR